MRSFKELMVVPPVRSFQCTATQRDRAGEKSIKERQAS